MRAVVFLAFAPALAVALVTGLPRPTLARGGDPALLAVHSITCPPQSAACLTSAPRSRDICMGEEAPFWENVVQFMRFGISSVLGLILGLLAPFTSVFGRSPALTAVGATLSVGVLVFFYLTLSAMESPPSEAIGLVPIIEPSMQQMMSDLYGN